MESVDQLAHLPSVVVANGGNELDAARSIKMRNIRVGCLKSRNSGLLQEHMARNRGEGVQACLEVLAGTESLRMRRYRLILTICKLS